MSDKSGDRAAVPWATLMKRALQQLLGIYGVPDLVVLVDDLSRSRTELDAQVDEAVRALQRSSELVATLESGVRERAERLAKLKEEYERYSQLADVESEKAAAIVSQLELSLGRSRPRERWIAFGLSIGAGLVVFIAGVLLNGPVVAAFRAIVPGGSG